MLAMKTNREIQGNPTKISCSLLKLKKDAIALDLLHASNTETNIKSPTPTPSPAPSSVLMAPKSPLNNGVSNWRSCVSTKLFGKRSRNLSHLAAGITGTGGDKV